MLCFCLFLKVINEEATLYFRNEPYMIDYILAYEPGTGDAESRKAEKRKSFEDTLRKEGLKLEYEGKEMSKSGKVCFVKIHAPWAVLTKYAEITNLKMPLAPNDMEIELEGCLEHFWNKVPSCFELDEEIVPPDPNYFTAPFNRDRVDQ
ncbi:hypothetical protein KUTeg_008017 [Tegillarca granosa]|uniref:Anoctamin dimerisation domain-containing protein n=1 Tax=Tegillarca granosa TaxID=220873 RepID=A0ABQ9FIV1_TEGGR|nr:hypothetical protein KUTeg_008017 [Tegillarca granosa]